jgi:hypothetical protein
VEQEEENLWPQPSEGHHEHQQPGRGGAHYGGGQLHKGKKREHTGRGGAGQRSSPQLRRAKTSNSSKNQAVSSMLTVLVIPAEANQGMFQMELTI